MERCMRIPWSPSPDFPYNSFPITYSAAPSGSWSQNSEYYWYSSLTGDSESGTFNPNSIYDFGATYVNPPVSSGKTDHIYIHLIDSQDGVDATNNYYMKFHKKYEDWGTNSTINHPMPIINEPVPSDWTYFQSVSNGYDVDETVSVTIKYSTSKTESGTIGGQLVTQSTDPEGFLAFQINEAITSTTQVTSSLSETIGIFVKAHSTVDVYVAPTWQYLSGTCSTWGGHGYTGDTDWVGIKVPNVNGVQALSVGYCSRE